MAGPLRRGSRASITQHEYSYFSLHHKLVAGLAVAGTVSRLGSNIGKLPCPLSSLATAAKHQIEGTWDRLQSGYNSVQLQFYASSQKANSSRRG